MGWFFVLLILIGVPVFMWTYRRRLDALSGPWIAEETFLHD
jgi:hypothetical protein